MSLHQGWAAGAKPRRGWFCGCLLLVGSLGVPARAEEPKPPPEGPEPVQLTAAAEPDLSNSLAKLRDEYNRSCDPRQLATIGDLRFLACGSAGVWALRKRGDEYELMSTQDVGGNAYGFFVHNRRLWVELSSMRAVDVALASSVLAPSAQVREIPAPAAPAPAAPARRTSIIVGESVPRSGRVRVTEQRDDHVIIQADDARALEQSHRVAFYPPSPARDPDAERGLSLRSAPVAIGRIHAIAGRRARVALGLNEAVTVGMLGELTALASTESTWAPPRAAGSWELAFLARPWIVLDDLGAGLFLDARVGYRFKFPLHVEARLAPLAFGSARQGLTAAFGAFASASFDSRVFEIGLGVGAQTINDPSFGLARGSGTLIAQRLRVGAIDGVHVEAFSHVTLFHSDFEFSSLRVQGQLPLGTRFWLLAAGGGGSMGVGYGEVGLRSLLWGNGLAGSFFLSVVIGGVHVFATCADFTQSCNEIDYTGPLLGAGGEWRL